MERLLRLTLSAALASALCVLGPPALADPADGTGTGGDVSGPGPDMSGAARSQAASKQAVADAYVAHKYHGGSPAALRASARSYARTFPKGADSRLKEFASADAGTVVTTSAPYASSSLGMTYYAQTQNWYCGPASGKMIVAWRGDGASAYNGESQTQAHLADLSHMKTDYYGKTAWASSLFRIGLNRWRQGTDTGYYVQTDSPSAIQFENDMVYDIDASYPLSPDTVEVAGSLHYNGHPKSETIGHWLIAKGYYNFGDSTYFLDPSTSVWSTASSSFSYGTASFTNNFLQSNGMAW
jgi:hypothetical protein